MLEVIGAGLGLFGALFGGGGRVDELTLQREAQEDQQAHELELAEFAERRQALAVAQQRELTRALLVGGGVLALGAVGTAVVVKS